MIPFEWMFGTLTKTANGTMVLSGSPTGKLTENLPSTLEDDEIDDTNTNTSPQSTAGTNVVVNSDGTVSIRPTEGGGAESGAAKTRTWVDWLMWR